MALLVAHSVGRLGEQDERLLVPADLHVRRAQVHGRHQRQLVVCAEFAPAHLEPLLAEWHRRLIIARAAVGSRKRPHRAERLRVLRPEEALRRCKALAADVHGLGAVASGA